MPKAHRLPSGSWNCRVLVGSEMVNGQRRRIYESVTVKDPSEDGRMECERIARKLERTAKRAPKDMTVKDALAAYVEKRKIMSRSPSTVSAYQSMAKCAYTQLLNVPVRKLTDEVVNEWMAEYQLTHSPKTCRNAYSFLCSAIHAVNPTAELVADLPDAKPFEYYDANDEDIIALLDAADDTMKKAILLAAYGSLRNGETCALTYGDIHGNKVTVNKDMVWDTDSRSYVLGACKNPQSRRTIIFPPEIIDALTGAENAPEQRIVPYTPRSLSARFARLRNKCGLPQMRYHDLRAYAASFRHALNIPSAFISSDGGWRQDSPVMKRVYIRAMEDRKREFSERAGADFVSRIVSPTPIDDHKFIKFQPRSDSVSPKNHRKSAKLAERMGFEPMRPFDG